MPYRLGHDGSQWLVVNEETGEVVGRHATRGEAVRHMQALYANVPDAKLAVRATIEQDVARAFLGAVRRLRAAVRRMSSAGDRLGLVTGRIPVRQAYAALEDPLASSLARAAKAAVRTGFAVGKVKAASDAELADQLAQEWALTQAGELVEGVTVAQLDAIQEAVAAGFHADETLAQVAKRIERTIGLTTRDARAVASLAARLEDSGVTGRALDKRVQAAVDRSVRRRARTIARTERVDAREEGKLEAWGQALADGDIPDDVRRKWRTRDPCRVCRALGALPPVPIGQPFVCAYGTFSSPTAHTNCKCWVVLVQVSEPG